MALLVACGGMSLDDFFDGWFSRVMMCYGDFEGFMMVFS